MSSFTLSEVVRAQSHFGRSVNLERDFYAETPMAGYVLTTTAATSLDRIARAVKDKTATRAWTITGAYGSGKSAFALFMAKLLDQQNSENEGLYEMLPKRGNGSFGRTVFGSINRDHGRFTPILVSGSREPLDKAILRGIRNALANSNGRSLAQLLKKIDEVESSSNVTGKDIVDLLNSIVKSTSRRGKTGILLVIDELGKLLEYAALNPSRSDVFILQELAEATRNSNVPILLVTILHQSFERYAERLGKRDREEWTKIQGRFEDVPFQVANEQLLHVLRRVFDRNVKSPRYQKLIKRGDTLARQAIELGLCGLLNKGEAASLLKECMPLHPLVALLLGPIFRRFGQNERSLFAFLTSNEPFSFAEFVQSTTWDKHHQPVLALDCVYDYLTSAIGSALIAGPDGRKWAEVDSALHRIPDASVFESKVLKTIGLFHVLGELGKIKCSRELLHFALTDLGTDGNQVNVAISSLQQKSVITERRFNDTFAIWEGSDVDLEERFSEAEKQNDRDFSLAEGLKSYFQRPMVAKRHSYRTGTLRYFEVSFANIQDVLRQSINPGENGDGRIIYALAKDPQEISLLSRKIESHEITVGTRTIIAIPKQLENLRESIWRANCWRWVLSSTPQLENDRAARKELFSRLAHAEGTVREWLDEWHTSTNSSSCLWFWKDRQMEFGTTRQLQEFLSTVFDEAYYATPVLKNELINRRYLSSAATAARRSLFEAMISKPDQDQLGIVGHPPQLSMYFSLFQETTIHREESGKFGFFPPRNTADKGIRLVWKEIEEFLEQTAANRLTVGDLFEALQKPPYGLKGGLLPLLVSSVFLYFDAEVALYERGNFLPKLTLPVFERLCRSPESFTIQLCRISGVRSTLLSKMAEALVPSQTQKKKVEILTLVRPLAKFAQELGEYSQHTSRISPAARNIRRALFSAREPDKLIFKLLPEACGIAEFKPKVTRSESDVEAFLSRLLQGLAELRRAYSELLNEIEGMLANAFSVSYSESRSSLERRCKAALEFASSAKLKGFMLRVADSKADRNEWLESIAAHLVGKPPAFWRDDDIAKFEIALAEVARTFWNLESLIFERLDRHDEKNVSLIRLNLAQIDRGECSRVISIEPREKEIVEETVGLLRSAFDESRINGNTNLRLATLAQLSLEVLRESERD